MTKLPKRLAVLFSAASLSLAAMAQTNMDSAKANGYFLGYDNNGKVIVAVSGTADYTLPAPTTPGLTSFDDLLTLATGFELNGNGQIVAYEYLPREANFKIVDASEYQQAVNTYKPATRFNVNTKISKVAETPRYISMRAFSDTKDQAGNRYDYSKMEMLNYDKATDSVIDYFDVFNSSAERKLREMMYPIAKKKYPLTVKSSDQIEIIQNFALTPEGVIFCFPESTIAPGNTGCPEILLTWDQLRRGQTLAEGAEVYIGK